MNLYDFVKDPAAIIEEAFKHPVMKIKPRAAKPYPDMDDATKATINAIEFATIYAVADEVRPLLEGVLLNMELMDGTHADADNKDEWESAVDDQVEDAIEKFVPILSSDWLGNHLIGSGIHTKEGLEKFTISMGREVFKQLTYAMEKSPTKILSAAGVTKAMLEERLNLHNQTKEETAMSDNAAQLDTTLQKILDYIGKDFDIMTVYDDLDLASDDDEGLALGAGQRLGIEGDDIVVLQNERLMNGNDTPNLLLTRLQELGAGKSAKKPAAKKPPAKAADKPAAKPAAKKGKGKKADDDAAASQEGAVSAATLQKFKETCTFKDADVAEKLMVSRATFNNWTNGKTPCELGAEQYTNLRGDIVDRLNALHEVLAELDNIEPHVVF